MAALLEMLSKQRVLMSVLGVFGLEQKIALLQAAIGMSCESAEVLSLLNKFARPWKPSKIDVNDTVEETIDVMFFTLELFNLLGLTEEDILNEYNKKLLINFARIISSASPIDRRSALHEVRKIGDGDIPKTSLLLQPYRMLILNGVLNGVEDIYAVSDDDIRFLADPIRFTRERVELMWPSENWKYRLPDSLK